MTKLPLPLLLALASLLSVIAPAVLAAPAPEKWAFWDKVASKSDAVIDHALWQSVLDKHLQISPDGINRFAYKDLSSQGADTLKAYLEAMAAIDPREYNELEQQAYWINVYNAVTVDVVLNNISKNSILRMGKGFFSVGPWDDEVFEVAGKALTLNDIEHRILRPIFKDHRVHYAVNCASIGCPNLSAQAFSGVELETQLAKQERDYLNHPRGLTFDKKGRLQLSQIYEWYQADFADSEKGLVTHLAERHATLGDKLAAYTGKIKYDYDWDLNTAN